jgi:hypothetical protein
MIWGVALLSVIFATFTVTHFLEFTSDASPLELAGELAMIVVICMFLTVGIIVSRNLL